MWDLLLVPAARCGRRDSTHHYHRSLSPIGVTARDDHAGANVSQPQVWAVIPHGMLDQLAASCAHQQNFLRHTVRELSLLLREHFRQNLSLKVKTILQNCLSCDVMNIHCRSNIEESDNIEDINHHVVGWIWLGSNLAAGGSESIYA